METTLARQVDSWTLRALAAGRHLTRLYRVLGDDKQASTALRVIVLAEERASRLGLRESAGVSPAAFEGGNEAEREASAWRALVETQAGLCAFHAIADDLCGSGQGMRGARHAAVKAYQRSIKGLRTAFPEAMAEEFLGKAIQAAAQACAEIFVENMVQEEATEQAREALQQEFFGQIQEGLQRAADEA